MLNFIRKQICMLILSYNRRRFPRRAKQRYGQETLSKRTRTAKRKGKEQLIKTICNLVLIDIWRKRNPCKTKYTYRNSIAKPTVQSWLDLWLVSDNIANSVTDCKIIPSIAPDHSAVTITVESTIQAERGPGLWKFNSEVKNK